MRPDAGFWDFYRAFRAAPFGWGVCRSLRFAYSLVRFERAVRSYRGPNGPTQTDRNDHD